MSSCVIEYLIRSADFRNAFPSCAKILQPKWGDIGKISSQIFQKFHGYNWGILEKFILEIGENLRVRFDGLFWILEKFRNVQNSGKSAWIKDLR